MANTEPGFLLVSCEYTQNPTNLELIRYFFLIFILPKKDQFWFLLILKIYEAEILQEKKNFERKQKLLSPQDSCEVDYFNF